jgi:DNA-binding NarL/FixJ family response regulator
VYRPIGVYHNLWCVTIITGTTEETNGEFFCRAAGGRDFTARQKAVLAEAQAAIGVAVGGTLARFGEPSPAALPPRVRQVLRCLLEGDGDKQIAKRLGLSSSTVNEYVKRIFGHFGVVSRAELLARWVRRGWGQNGPGWAEAP